MGFHFGLSHLHFCLFPVLCLHSQTNRAEPISKTNSGSSAASNNGLGNLFQLFVYKKIQQLTIFLFQTLHEARAANVVESRAISVQDNPGLVQDDEPPPNYEQVGKSQPFELSVMNLPPPTYQEAIDKK